MANVNYEKIDHIINRQYEAEQAFLAEFEAGNFTLANPLVKLNPYEFCPLSAVVMFDPIVFSVRQVCDLEAPGIVRENQFRPIRGNKSARNRGVVLKINDNPHNVGNRAVHICMDCRQRNPGVTGRIMDKVGINILLVVHGILLR